MPKREPEPLPPATYLKPRGKAPAPGGLRTESIECLLTPQERHVIGTAAAIVGVPVAEFVRDAAMQQARVVEKDPRARLTARARYRMDREDQRLQRRPYCPHCDHYALVLRGKCSDRSHQARCKNCGHWTTVSVESVEAERERRRQQQRRNQKRRRQQKPREEA